MPNDLTPTHSHKGRAAAPQGRLSRKVRDAIKLIEREYMTQRQAAKVVGVRETYLSVALKKPAALAEREKQKELAIQDVARLKTTLKAQALHVGQDLLHNAKSESVRARMVEFFAGEAKKGNEINVQTAVHIGSGGYEFAPHGAEIVEVQPTQDSTSGAPDSQEPENKDKSD